MRSRWLSIRLLFLLLAMVATAAAGKRESRNICGIVARFTVLNDSIAPGGKLRVRLILENHSGTTAEFRYFAGSFLQHVRVFTERQKPAPIRTDAPFLEAAADRITLKPGEKVETELSIVPSQRYDLSAGKYHLQFHYDLRLIIDEQCAAEFRKRYGGEDWVPWDTKRFSFSVTR